MYKCVRVHCGCHVCVAACVSFHISACVFRHNDTVICYVVEELLNLELSVTMTSSIVPVLNVECPI